MNEQLMEKLSKEIFFKRWVDWIENPDGIHNDLRKIVNYQQVFKYFTDVGVEVGFLS